MKIRFIFLLIFIWLNGFSQNETHDFIRYDTTINFSTGSWLVRIERPRNYFTAGHPDTASRPWILMQPGQGEMGNTDTTGLSAWGPSYYRNHGWDGGVQLGNGKHYPILITAKFINNVTPATVCSADLFDYLYAHYKPKPGCINITGLSQGSFDWTSLMVLERSANDETYIKKIRTLVALSGFATDLSSSANAPYNTWARGLPLYALWAKKYGGRYMGMEGYNDVTRNTWKGAKAMNDTLGGTGYFSYVTIASGGHGGWNTEYDPNFFDWRTGGSATKGPYYSPSQPPPFGAGGVDTMGNYKYPSSIYQWMLRQGDTSLVGQAAVLSVTNVVCAEYRSGWIKNDTLYSYNNGSIYPMAFPLPGGRLVLNCAGGFNSYQVTAKDGTAWTNYNDFTTNWTQWPTDTTGAAFINNVSIFAYANTTVTIKSDGTLWLYGDDTVHLFHTTGGVLMRPTQLLAAGQTFKKVVIGHFRIIGLTTDGKVYEWTFGNGNTGVQKTLTGLGAGFAVDIFGSHLDYAGCIIPALTGSQTMGYPYVWGNYFSAWGGTTTFTQPTSVKTLWGVNTPIRVILVNWNTTHYIDSLNKLYGLGFNSQGEVGNGQEFVNKYTYSTWPSYGWTSADGENFSGVPAQQIGVGIQWDTLWSNNFFTYYKYARDKNNNYYSWGRNKANVLGNGLINQQQNISNCALDVLQPTIVTPLTAAYTPYNFTNPSISAGSDQTISSSSVILSGVVQPALLVKSSFTAANGIDTAGYNIVSYLWIQLSGGTCVITNPNASTTSVNGLSTGVYKFQLKTVDNNTGTMVATIQITVNTAQPVCNAGPNQIITVPINSVSLIGTGSAASGHSLVSFTWTQLNGLSTAIITSPNTSNTNVTNLQVGVYTFRLTVKDDINQTANSDVQITVNPFIPFIGVKRLFGTSIKMISN